MEVDMFVSEFNAFKYVEVVNKPDEISFSGVLNNNPCKMSLNEG